jgi:hypothetical protein
LQDSSTLATLRINHMDNSTSVATTSPTEEKQFLKLTSTKLLYKKLTQLTARSKNGVQTFTITKELLLEEKLSEYAT